MEHSPATTTTGRDAVDQPVVAAALLRAVAVDRPGHVLVRLEGEVDMTASGALAAVRDQVAACGLPVVVDASQVSFMDCAGLAVVLGLAPAGTRASVTAASSPVRLVLDLAARAGLAPAP